ncbi:hypothetical protein [Longimicrobium terrae]|uniref:Uncharacterized protein n=1 Tax=Longimicrobium terrae TaxID=1639882 RepID=A0A841H4Y7_9BACT|nr:hypothetical protein [Longimicrobium terrae]MBB4638898.1 hypothetical protein [Longimicrobium terrae]MBB6073137.1 hypothetical protein [Longimicrobium terrae]NNC30176.1 hypothetical protein [Longimicrobium terrae]
MTRYLEHRAEPENAADGRKWRYFRRVMWAVGAASIIGIADQLRALGWLALEKAAGSSEPWSATGWPLLFLAGWALLAFSAYRVVRQNRVPPTWGLVALLVISYVALGLQTFRR